ncbi:sulfatase-like hydrolase/transferase [uncultured Gimesia sp.]|uniref:sulfatase family protein n=1 Tax=uncultured Gimesia sp. TaxID=1678688 RepID=UPI0030D92DCE|tara:strand:- start:43414 stop:44853 length:1440 start_codon:yes stop_codon:yes gene_type:complete
MRSLLITFVLLQSLFFLETNQVEAASPPNILFIFTDDQAPWALGQSGHPHAKTPNIDRIFQQGAYLVNSFTTTPVCSPSRASLVASRYGSELEITDWIHPRTEPNHGLKPDTVTWMKLLNESGYRTGLIGKWHLGLLDKHHPTQFGYDYFMGFRSGGNVPKDPTLEVNGKNTKLKGLLPDILVDDAIQFINKEQGTPFMLSLHFRAPHTRWLPVAEEDWAPFKDLDPQIPNPDYPDLNVKRVKKMTREYLASVASVDRNVGRLLQSLKQNQLDQNTIIIFSSDHGYNMGHNGIWHKGNGHWVLNKNPKPTPNIPAGQRPNMYDTSLKIPTAVLWPGVTQPNQMIKQTVSNLDWFPTLLEMAQTSKPDNLTIRGRSIVPLLKNEKQTEWDNDFYAEYSTKHQSKTHMRMYRTPEWKLIRDFLNPSRDELYHLTKDKDETNNLINSKDPQVIKIRNQLHQKILSQMKSIDDKVLLQQGQGT